MTATGCPAIDAPRQGKDLASLLHGVPCRNERAGALGGFAIYTFGYRDTGSSGLSRSEKERVASILQARIAGTPFYIDDIKRTSPGHYLVRVFPPSVDNVFQIPIDVVP